MRLRNKLTKSGKFISVVAMTALVASTFAPHAARGAERKFIVMLANSPKQHGAAQIPAGGLEDPAAISRAYFAKDGSGSFAEYWEEISYGDVTVSGQVTDWIELPWSIQPMDPNVTPGNYVDLNINDGTFYRYGIPEEFDPSRAMINVDLDGDPGRPPVDNGPFLTDMLPGGGDTTPNAGQDVWMPGQRFLDMDEDGKWDGLDEATNQMDWTGPGGMPDGKPDNLGPWIDLNGDGIPSNQANCVYLPDSDNDGNPDCCPNGPGQGGCMGLGRLGNLANACTPTQWTVPPNDALWQDCNGNLIPDPCDISCTSPECLATGFDTTLDSDGDMNPDCGQSADNLPYAENASGCFPAPDEIPDECQFFDSTAMSVPAPCVNGLAAFGSACFGFADCAEFAITIDLSPRCEFDDANDNGVLDVVEPFESFIRAGDRRTESVPDPLPGIILDDLDDPANATNATYVSENYPGNPLRVIRQSVPRRLIAAHDPFGKLAGTGATCVCADGSTCISFRPAETGSCSGNGELCNTQIGDCFDGSACLIGQPDAAPSCLAGEHLGYVSPDFWVDQGNTKMYRPDDEPDVDIFDTPEPSWFQDAWEDRYDCSDCTPAWDIAVPRMISVPLDERYYFSANRGGLNGNGSGWLGSPEARDLEFTTGVFEDILDRPILPEEMNGIGTTLVLFDSYVEHDDLPSSKYHHGGDQRLGEVTSPFNNSIFGQDLAPPASGGDGVVLAAGPLATRIHGTLNADAGNLLSMEYLTWRTVSPFNTGEAWEGRHGLHPYASPSGEGLGFRDFNLDGTIDQGQVRPIDTENYVADGNPQVASIPGTSTEYPWNRQRLLEDCVEALDQIVDFDGFIDTSALEAAECNGFNQGGRVPVQYGTQNIPTEGIVSGIVLLSSNSHAPQDFLQAPLFYPIHNEDNSNANFIFPNSRTTGEKFSWNLHFHDLVIEMDDPRANSDFLTGYSAHEYLHSWEGFPDLYDYDIYKNQPGVKINTPVGQWDIMAGSGAVPLNLVHPVPILKELRCTQWIKPIDLKTILTPGVDTAVTLPRSEFVRDDSHFFFENESRLGERFYFWSVGNGFNTRMPGNGVLVLHTDVGSNPDATPALQGNGTRFNYVIVQADGNHSLEDGAFPYGDAGDPWPGSTQQTVFDCTTDPASQWYTLGACTGLNIVDIQPDGQGSAVVTFNWQPTNIPGFSFIDPPGGTSVGGTYQVRFRASDVFGATDIKLYYTTDDTDVSTTTGTFAGQANKTTPGFVDMSIDWNINGLPDGRYFLFAELTPGSTPDGSEQPNTSPRPGRNNLGNETLSVLSVDTSIARTETWVAQCISANGDDWVVTSTLTQPAPDDLTTVPASYLATRNGATGVVSYTSVGGGVSFEIQTGSTIPAVKSTIDDKFTFITTGVSALSQGVTIIDGRISENPVAKIVASPLTGKSGLVVTFDGRQSFNPEGRSLDFNWTFGDGSAATGSQTTHVYTGATTYTAILRVTDATTGRFGEASVDIALDNNSPTASISASPLSGATPLLSAFSGTNSTDTEDTTSDLVYEWDFGDGTKVSSGIPGQLITTTHFYVVDGLYTASLTVTDTGGKSDSETIQVLVGNSFPIVRVTNSSTRGSDGLEVIFNAINSDDPDGDTLEITWDWDDGTTDGPYPLTGPPGETDGSVPHVFNLRSGESASTFHVTAVLSETQAGGVSVVWPGVTITLFEAAVGISDPFAKFSIDSAEIVAGQSFSVDASGSFDRPSGNPPSSFEWNWGDGSTSTGVTASHTYAQPGTYAITLTVLDAETPPNANSTQRTVIVVGQSTEPDADNVPPTAVILADPTRGPAGSVFTFDAGNSTDPEGTALTYSWDFGDGQTGTGVTATNTYAVPGDYVVRLTVRDAGNASAGATQAVEVTDPAGNRPPQAIIGTGLRSGPVPLRITFNGQNSFDPNGDPLVFVWEIRLDDELIGTESGAILVWTFEDPGMYEVLLRVDDGRGGVRESEVAVVTATPQGGPIDDDPGQDVPDPDDPTPVPPLCGLGMIGTTLASLAGFTGFAMCRRRRIMRFV